MHERENSRGECCLSLSSCCYTGVNAKIPMLPIEVLRRFNRLPIYDIVKKHLKPHSCYKKVVMLSYKWESEDKPDVEGLIIPYIMKTLDIFDIEDNVSVEKTFFGPKLDLIDDVGIFVDYCCLDQNDGVVKSLVDVNIGYLHLPTIIYNKLDSYKTSSWCQFESGVIRNPINPYHDDKSFGNCVIKMPICLMTLTNLILFIILSPILLLCLIMDIMFYYWKREFTWSSSFCFLTLCTVIPSCFLYKWIISHYRTMKQLMCTRTSKRGRWCVVYKVMQTNIKKLLGLEGMFKNGTFESTCCCIGVLNRMNEVMSIDLRK